jgi:hypothetical protein
LHPVEIEAGRVECFCGVFGGGEHFLAVELLIRGEPQLDSRPVEVIVQLVVRVRTTAEAGVVVSCDEVRDGAGPRGTRCGPLPRAFRVRGFVGHPFANRIGAQMTTDELRHTLTTM